MDTVAAVGHVPDIQGEQTQTVLTAHSAFTTAVKPQAKDRPKQQPSDFIPVLNLVLGLIFDILHFSKE